MKFISLFAGIGGFDLALTRQGHECVWANEWDKYAAQIYDKNFCSTNRKENGGSQEIKKVGGSQGYPEPESPDAEGGQSSQYGNDNGNRQKPIDTRDLRTVPTSEIPDHDLLVGGFPCQAFSIAGKRRGFDDTRGTLFFEVARILRDKKPRLFILENVKGLLSHDNGNTFKTIISTLVELGYDLQWQVLNSKNFGVPQNRERVFIIGHLRGTSRPEIFPIGEKVSFDLAQTLSAGHYNQPKILADSKIRRLTPIECERLQGFPDNWTEGVSDTQRYKCLGNAVTVNVVEYLVKNLLNLPPHTNK